MAILPHTTGVHHFALRSSDLARSRAFYIDTLGFSAVMDTREALVFLAGSTVIGVLAPDEDLPAGDRFSPARVGLDHVALGCDTEKEISRVAGELSTAGVPNTGVKNDAATGKLYVAFSDPDGILWELYLV